MIQRSAGVQMAHLRRSSTCVRKTDLARQVSDWAGVRLRNFRAVPSRKPRHVRANVAHNVRNLRRIARKRWMTTQNEVWRLPMAERSGGSSGSSWVRKNSVLFRRRRS